MISAFGTGQEHGLGRAAPTIDDAAQIDLHEDHAKQVVADLYPPRKREIEAAGLWLVCGEDGVGGPAAPQGKKGSEERNSDISCRSVAATTRPSRFSRISEAAPISST